MEEPTMPAHETAAARPALMGKGGAAEGATAVVGAAVAAAVSVERACEHAPARSSSQQAELKR